MYELIFISIFSLQSIKITGLNPFSTKVSSKEMQRVKCPLPVVLCHPVKMEIFIQRFFLLVNYDFNALAPLTISRISLVIAD